MPCDHVTLPNGGTAIICSRGSRKPKKCAWCLPPARDSIALCDHPMGGGRTCDSPLCHEHRHHVAPDRDYCPPHVPGTTRPRADHHRPEVNSCRDRVFTGQMSMEEFARTLYTPPELAAIDAEATAYDARHRVEPPADLLDLLDEVPE